jgi:hypothetical protein
LKKIAKEEAIVESPKYHHLSISACLLPSVTKFTASLER